MNHLTLDEIIDFVSLTEINDETLQLLGKVNAHIAQCKECRELVRAYQLVYEEAIRMGIHGGFSAKTAAGQAAVAAISAADLLNDLNH